MPPIHPDPKIYLALDTCFALKRWVRPGEQMAIAKSLGVKYLEASTDADLDPLMDGLPYLKDWALKARQESRKSGVKIANYFSGHGSYTTLGLGHPDGRVRRRVLNLWLKKVADTAALNRAGFGFFVHAFDQATLEDPASYGRALKLLYLQLAEMARYAAAKGLPCVAVEQMYSPHQVPWTIDSAKALLKEVYRLSSKPFYLTLDTGHMAGQAKYMHPGGLGTHLFAARRDADAYTWIQELGRYSPILHLQQTDGSVSGHWPFDAQHNAKGIISPAKVVAALKRSFVGGTSAEYPPPVKKIYLTLEIFPSTADQPKEILKQIKDSVQTWRRAVPEDGRRLSRL